MIPPEVKQATKIEVGWKEKVVNEDNICKECDGEGWVSGYGHDCDGTEQECSMRCPVQTQEYCTTCGGSGEISERE